MLNIFKRNKAEEIVRAPVKSGTAIDVLVVESDPKFLLHLNNMVRTAHMPDNKSWLFRNYVVIFSWPGNRSNPPR